MKNPFKYAPRNLFHHDKKGITQVEVLVTVALIGIIGAAFSLGLNTGMFGTARIEEKATAISLARSQLQTIQGQPYATLYPTLDEIPPGYTVNFPSPSQINPFLQELSVSVEYQGKSLFQVTTYKAKRAPDGSVPPSGGMEGVKELSLPSLKRRQGFFYVIDVLETQGGQILEARWILPSFGQLVSLYLYQGRPFGSGPSGVVDQSPPEGSLMNARTTDLVLEMSYSSPGPGFYTLYFYTDEVSLGESQASVSAVFKEVP